jgi:hypothetical protein
MSDRARSEGVDRGDGPVESSTPGPGSKFEFVDQPEPGRRSRGLGRFGE